MVTSTFPVLSILNPISPLKPWVADIVQLLAANLRLSPSTQSIDGVHDSDPIVSLKLVLQFRIEVSGKGSNPHLKNGFTIEFLFIS